MHENVSGELSDWFNTNLERNIRVVTALGWRPDDNTYCEPDLIVFPRRFRTLSKVPATEVLLLIEVADTSLKSDLTTKATLYSQLGVREYWVVDAFTRTAHVHREPTADGFREKRKVPKNRLLKPYLLPGIELRLDDLAIDGE